MTGNDVFGADGVDLLTGVAVTTAADQGHGGLQQQRHLHLHADGWADGSDSFTYTITDGDGDSSTATVSITLAADSVPSVALDDEPDG